MLELALSNKKVRIDAGELVGFTVGDHEYIHQKGSPGWRSSDTEMFPVIGPTNEANFRVSTLRGEAVQDQHGLLREMEYQLMSQTVTSAIYRKNYRAGTSVKNSKYPKKSTEEFLSWPYDFQFKKSFELKDLQLEIALSITGEKGMPFMLGYHPAFKLHSDQPIITAGKKAIQLSEVLAVGNRAMPILNCGTITLRDKRDITIKTEGFGNFMLWTEVANMICIEPITFYPYAVDQSNLSRGFQYLEGKEKVFKIHISIGS
ncbi:aldose 1-epimerase [Flavobacteriaceae bacterium F89]|uniref:Aldose 1-epimerase n=1 Tax=Cerina litoralis TaxID=2874477 RepID=A0AAE3ETZ8_9FLAO|nr:aldose 1-epimerase [Cerina litoralis]MCG2459746.1 aldose 1-epimerase [Cerina litoralis]